MNPVFHNAAGELRSGWKALSFVGVYLAVAVVLGLLWALLVAMLGKQTGTNASVGISTLAAVGASVVCLSSEDMPLSSIGLALDRRWWRQALGGVGMGLLCIAVLAAFLGITGAVRWERLPASPWAVLKALPLLMAVAVSEELMFRGYPFQRLVEGVGFWPAQAVSAVLFGAVHLTNPNQGGAVALWSMVDIALAGLLFGAAWWRTRSLALPIGLHLAWNWAQGPIFGFGVSGSDLTSWIRAVPDPGHPTWYHGGRFGLEASLPCAVLLALAIAGVVLWKRGRCSVDAVG